MDEGLLSFFLENFGINIVIVVITVVAIFFFIYNLPKFIDSITYFQSRKIKHITEALSSEWVDDNYKKLLKKDISKLYLSGTLKIKASERQVKEIINLSNITEDNFSTLQIYHAVKILLPNFYNLNLVNLKIERSRVKIINYKIRIIHMILIIFILSIYLFFEDEIVRELYYTYTGDNYISLVFIFPVFMFNTPFNGKDKITLSNIINENNLNKIITFLKDHKNKISFFHNDY
ncbi:MAG: hypothetical protein Q8884_02425, partial [Sweet potato little leaf phytoplasma]|nr:hypothetical protein [Sweet potato little leaf phytoplasma]